jgi:methyltransferase (TIGR00027 family)
MKQNQSSQSAAGVAFFRACEAQKPETERICYDPYASAFVSRFLLALNKLINLSDMYERMSRGSTSFIFVRERYIDDVLKASLSNGLEQVVILGAGFDTRAYRIAGIEKTRVFEIDFPATQEVKLKGLRKIFNPLPDHVTFLPVDFNTQTLEERLLSSGYNERAKTLFIWQGVTYFLTAEGVDSTLAFIANHSGPGSAVIFDYFYNEVLRDPSRKDIQAMRKTARMAGEEYMFGIDRDGVEPFLTQRNFHEVHNMTLEDLKQLYFTGPNARRMVPDGLAIVSAEVDEAKV